MAATAVADLAIRCLLLELKTWPKPGLVSHHDSGSHTDMDADTFRRSADALWPFFGMLAEAGARGCAMDGLRSIGLDAERAMFAATGGVNTHRGAIFGLGLLCAAACRRTNNGAGQEETLGSIVYRRWHDGIVNGPILPNSHGERACRRFGIGGARHEAASGFPSVYGIGLPALREGLSLARGDVDASRVHACFALIANVDDTNILHRRGAPGLMFARTLAGKFLDDGSVGRPDWLFHACAVHRAFVERRISPGGSADLLAMSLFVQAIEAGTSVESAP